MKGYILAAIAAATYGTNPAFAVPLYLDGMNPTSVLLFRYGLCLPILAVMIFYRGRSLRLSRTQILPVAVLGILMALSSLSLFEAYNYMNSGIASTLLFIYPVLVAILMCFFFHERFRITTGICLVVMGAGLLMLLRTDGTGKQLSGFGCLMVLVSSLTYALYLVMTNVSKTVQKIPTLPLLFYQFLFGSTVFVFMLAVGRPLTLPSQPWGWLNLMALAALPSVVSLGCTTAAIHHIGSTATAIFGALEPLTAVVLSVVLLNQSLATHEIVGGLLIMAATTLVVAADPVENVLLRVRKMFPPLRRR
ncbi:MAG: DMT family transporter [Bacteroides sp.]|nr:DMT family transporter [Roseburia sp.]MCM1347586.1 DMT family transporter [Bacteroides sp.]MCM1420394.1 DMT family transporter [Bacteroides sp.]